ncbi:MAG TPA: DUF975 family protein [bacterium]|uniref:Uncharacterized protein n=1 Tax=candidate division TA06 bacterium ADurb.Bin417 TaxID=1852828 RepID=A0A1V5M9J7_UNCT6|nr:MAG: hypothetical protein BWY73_01425 [candidate division TA06 bacterium ADurb.Bin417]HNS47911.1 DUF975 family protein [bacterium]
MDEKKFDWREALGWGWRTTKENLGFFVRLLLIFVLVELVFGLLTGPSGSGPSRAGLAVFLLVLLQVVARVVMELGMTRINLNFVDGQPSELRDLFGSGRFFWPYLGASLLYLLAIVIGLILLVIPGFYLAIRLQFFPYLIVERGMGPVEALRKSAAITRGSVWRLFLFSLLLIGVNILGLLALVVGLFVTVPTTMLAMARVYRNLLEADEPAAPEAVPAEPVQA